MYQQSALSANLCDMGWFSSTPFEGTKMLPTGFQTLWLVIIFCFPASFLLLFFLNVANSIETDIGQGLWGFMSLLEVKMSFANQYALQNKSSLLLPQEETPCWICSMDCNITIVLHTHTKNLTSFDDLFLGEFQANLYTLGVFEAVLAIGNAIMTGREVRVHMMVAQRFKFLTVS